MTLSIITATYNSADTLTDTLESVLAQTFTDYELIIVDGQSTDGTLEIIERYAPRFEGRLRVVSEPDQGIYDAMNKGIRMCRGEVVGLLNSDDFYTSPHVLATLAKTIEDSRVDAVYGDVHYVAPNDVSKMVRYYSSRPFRPWMMRLGFMPAHPSFYCRREVYQQYGLFDIQYKVAADFEQLLRLIFIHRITTAYVPLDCVTMRVGGASSSGLQSHRRILSDHLQAFRQHHVYTNVFLLSLRYLYKMAECLTTRSKSVFRTRQRL